MAGTTASNSDANLPTIYSLIHSFLLSRSHDKAAAAVKKAAKDIVVLKDDVKVDENATLDEIIAWWKAKKAEDAKRDETSDSSDSSDDSDSSSDSSSSSDSDSSTSDSDSDTSTSSESDAKKPGLGANKLAKPLANGESKKKKSTTEKTSEKPKKVETPATSSDDSIDSTDDDKASKKPTALTKSKISEPTAASETSAVDSSKRTSKKRKISEIGESVPTAVVSEQTATSTPAKNGDKNGKKPRKSNTPFQRVKIEDAQFYDERLKDNTFISKGGSANDYGARANADLIVTRGDSFRKEKNKKKRGSYRGGEITLESHSIKFT